MSIKSATNQELISGIVARLNELIDRINGHKQDKDDMFNAAKTEFYRCKCGRIREIGLQCINPDCTVEEKS